jgi:hypothetical protein
MERQISSEQRRCIAPLWMRIFFGAVCLFLVVAGIWRHGLRSWDWVISIIFLGPLIFPTGLSESLARRLNGPLPVVFLLWVIVCSAWLLHSLGWVAALAFAAILLLTPGKERCIMLKNYVRKSAART